MFVGGQTGKVNVVNLAKPVGDHPHGIRIVFGHHGNDVQIDGSCHHDAIVMVGVVAADLGPAGRRVKTDGPAGAEILFKIFNQFHIAVTLGRNHSGIVRVKFGKRPVIGALPDALFEFCTGCHDSLHLSVSGVQVVFVRYAQK